MKYQPLASEAGSVVLASIHKLADKTGLGNSAEYPLELAYGAFLARACVRRFQDKTADRSVGLSAGFHDGDLIHLGQI
jgi:hypothetical protein